MNCSLIGTAHASDAEANKRGLQLVLRKRARAVGSARFTRRVPSRSSRAISLPCLLRRIRIGAAVGQGIAAGEPSTKRFQPARSGAPGLWHRPDGLRPVCVVAIAFGSGACAYAPERLQGSSQLTLRWRETDSNLGFRVQSRQLRVERTANYTSFSHSGRGKSRSQCGGAAIPLPGRQRRV
jgi:hypothetical protein